MPGDASVALTTRGDGDARPVALGGDGASELLYKSICDRPWSFVHQIHGGRVLSIDRPQSAPEDADALVTTAKGMPLSVLGADCALVGLAGDGVVAAAHAGWRGLVAGVIDSTVEAMRERGAGRVRAVVSACIHPECYEFSPEDVDLVAAWFGDEVRAHTAGGEAALDLPATVRCALRRAGVELTIDLDACTACETEWYSHRARNDRARHALVVWRELDHE